MYQRRDGQCLECTCSNGEIECEMEEEEDSCRRGRSRSRSRSRSRGRDYSCEYDGVTLEDGESVDVDCNVCRCRRGKVSCTRRPCPGQRECRDICRNATRGPVCGPGGVTFPSRCVATCFGLNDSELLDEPCSNRVSFPYDYALTPPHSTMCSMHERPMFQVHVCILSVFIIFSCQDPCTRFPCPEGSICIARKPRCFFRRGSCQSIYQLRVCGKCNLLLHLH